MSEHTKKESQLTQNYRFVIWWAVSLLAIIGIVSVVFFICASTWFGWDSTKNNNSEILELLTPIIGGIVASWVAFLVAMRLEKFSEQVDIQNEQQKAFTQQVANTKQQLFNESFERGVTLLAHDNMTMRRSGIRVLWDLGKTSIPEQAKLIVEIIHDFVDQKTQPDYEEDSYGDQKLTPAKDRKERRDIELAIFALADLIDRAEMETKDILFEKLDLRGLDFSNLDLSNAKFDLAILDKVNFHGAKLNQSEFVDANLNEANFYNAQLNGASFDGAELESACFIDAELNGTYFQEAKLHEAKFNGTELYQTDLQGAELHRVSFFRATFRGVLFWKAELYGADLTGANLSMCEYLTKERIEKIVFGQGKPPDPFNDMDLPTSRAYTWKPHGDGNKYRKFVESKEEWSEQWVDEWIDKEIAEAKAKKEKAIAEAEE